MTDLRLGNTNWLGNYLHGLLGIFIAPRLDEIYIGQVTSRYFPMATRLEANFFGFESKKNEDVPLKRRTCRWPKILWEARAAALNLIFWFFVAT